MTGRCPYHDEIVRGQASLATKVDGIQKDVSQIKTILTGPDGTNGLVGTYNKARGGWWVTALISTVVVAVWTLVKELFGRG